MPLLDHFGWIAPHYDQLASPPDVGAWVERLRLPVDGYLLDAGGGTGRLSAPLRPLTRGVIVADSNPGMTRQSAAKPGLRAVCGEVEQLPFPDEFFDRIMMVDAFHHVRSQPAAALELVRVLKPGGRLVIEDPDLRYGKVKLISFFEKMLLMRTRILSCDQALALFAALPLHASLVNADLSYYLIAEKITG